MVKAVAALWDAYKSFREAATDILALTEDQLKALEALTRSGFDLDPNRVAAELGISPFDAQAVLRVVSSLYGAARVEELSGREVVDALLEMALPHAEDEVSFGDAEAAALASILDRRESVDLDRARKTVEGAYLPVLETVEMGVDLRVRNTPDDNREFQLVPVAVARLVFDEPAGATNVVHFQIPPTILEELHMRIRDVEDQMKAVSSSGLADWLL